MAASGLNAKHRAEIGGNDEDSICEIVEFAIAMRQKLQEVNMDAFNTFQLRVGISSGPLISGVIGARKPIFDIWGNTGLLIFIELLIDIQYFPSRSKRGIANGFNR
jgi:adenylate cyclase 8